MHKKTIVAIVAAFIILVCVLVLIAVETTAQKDMVEKTVVNSEELVIECDAVAEPVSLTPEIQVDVLLSDYQEVLENAKAVTVENAEVIQDLTEAELLILEDIELLKAGHELTVFRYFGNSEVFTPELVADRVSPAEVTFITNPNDTSVYLHICTLNYTEIVEALIAENSQTAKDKVAADILDGKYDCCYTVPVTVKNNLVVITESLKQALTGGWYKGTDVDLEFADCIVPKN